MNLFVDYVQSQGVQDGTSDGFRFLRREGHVEWEYEGMLVEDQAAQLNASRPRLARLSAVRCEPSILGLG